MQRKASVAVGVRTFDRPVMLRRAIEDVLAQTHTNWELRIVNNGGDPATVDAVVAEFESRLDGRCTVKHAPQKLAIATACNECFEGSTSDFFLVHDDDDTLDPTFLERTIADLRSQDPVYGAVATRCDHVDEVIEDDGSITEVARGPHNPNMLTISFESVLVANPCPPICLLVTREAFYAAGGYEPTQDHASDWMFLLKLLTKYRVAVIPEVLAHYHHRSGLSNAYANAVSNESQIARGDAQLRDHFVGRALRDGELTEAQVALSVSEADREIHMAVRELIGRVNELQLLVGDIDNRLQHVHGFSVKHDVTLRRIDKLIAPFARGRKGSDSPPV